MISCFGSQVTNTNRKLSRPLSESQVELTDLRKKLEHFTKERAALQRLRSQYAAMSKELNGMKWETEALKMRCEKLTEEKARLRKSFEEALLEVEQKQGLKCMQLERKAKELSSQQERLREIFGGDSTDLPVLIESSLHEKDEHIIALESELAELSKRFRSLASGYEDSAKAKRISCTIAPITIAKQKA